MGHMPHPLKFERSCTYCGARFEVVAEPLPGDRELQEYDCPECHKAYEVESTGHPRVRLLHRRSDGKDDRYQETMF